MDGQVAVEALANSALEHLYKLLSITQDIITQFSCSNKTTPNQVSENKVVGRIVGLQQQYEETSRSLRTAIIELQQISPREEIVEDPDRVAALEAKLAVLRKEAQDKNETLYQLIQTLRNLLDGMGMWETYAKMIAKDSRSHRK